MIPITISPDLKAVVPNVAVGWITANVQVTEHDEALWQEIEAAAARFRGMTMDEARKFPPIKALRDAYRALGNDPTRYRGSNEALVRRITQGKELYRVNTVVDINNLISLETLAFGGHVRSRPHPAADHLPCRAAGRILRGHRPGRDQDRGAAGVCRSAWPLRQHDQRFRTDDGAAGDDPDYDGRHLVSRSRGDGGRFERAAGLLGRYAAASEIRTELVG